MITSRHNPRIKEIRLLKQVRHRRAQGRFFIEGVRLLEEAMGESAPIRILAYSPRLERNERGMRLLSSLREKLHDVEWLYLSDAALDSLATTETHQGILAVLDQRRWNAEDLWQRQGIILLLCAIQDPGNLGTLLRLAEAARAAGLILGRGSADPYNPKAVRASMGSIFRLPLLADQDLNQWLIHLRGRGYRIWAADARKGTNFWDVDFGSASAILLGQEGGGIPPELWPAVDATLTIPMAEPVDSLNVAMAGGILLYEAARQRKKARSPGPSPEGKIEPAQEGFGRRAHREG